MMKKTKPLARVAYTTAFVLPFMWTASGNAVPIFEERSDAPIMTTYGETIDYPYVTATVDIATLANLDNDPTVITPEEREMMALINQLIVAAPTQQ